MRIERETAHQLAQPVSHDAANAYCGDNALYTTINLGHDEERFQFGEINDAYHRFRYEIYREHDYLGHSTNLDSMEFDDDDERSSHFVTLKRQRFGAVVIGCMRLIRKENDIILPVEEYFGDAFPEPAANGSAESSRFIAAEKSGNLQLMLMGSLMTMAYLGEQRHNPKFNDVYGVVGRDLTSTLRNAMGMEVRELHGEKPVPYGTDDIAIYLPAEQIGTNLAPNYPPVTGDAGVGSRMFIDEFDEEKSNAA